MAVLSIIRAPLGPPGKSDGGILRQKAADVSKVDKSIRALLDNMTETLAAAGGLGLAALQVGIQKRLFIVKNGTEYLSFVNPIVLASEGAQASPEACLSLPGVYGMVRRPGGLIIRALNENGKSFDFEGTGRLAAALSHEYDHLEGILFTDRAYAVRRFDAPIRLKTPGS